MNTGKLYQDPDNPKVVGVCVWDGGRGLLDDFDQNILLNLTTERGVFYRPVHDENWQEL